MEENTKVFDYLTLSQRYGIDANDLKRIIVEVQDEFKDDEMMAELHIVRAIRRTIQKNRQGALV